jgi:hypothetical protein
LGGGVGVDVKEELRKTILKCQESTNAAER